MLMPGGSESPNSDIVIRDFYEDRKNDIRATARNRADADRKVRDYEAYVEAKRPALEAAQAAQWESERKERERKKKGATGEAFFEDAANLVSNTLGDLWDSTIGKITGLDTKDLGKFGELGFRPETLKPQVNLPQFDFASFQASQSAARLSAGNAELNAAGFRGGSFGSGAVSSTKGVKEFSDSFAGKVDASRYGYTQPNLSLPDFDFFGGPKKAKELYEL
ncbi:MAG: hypothetical protein KF713_20455 [Turneriella sp.]|nr:hypothetical protein [Turneriella sp.]